MESINRAGFIRRATLVIVTSCMFFGTSAFADNNDLPSQTIAICSDATHLDSKLIHRLENAGWQAVDRSDVDMFSAVLADGVAAAMSNDATARTDWSNALPDAQQFSTAIFNAALKEQDVSAFLSHKVDLAALVLITDPINPAAFRCIYSGPGDTELRQTLEIISQMDKRAGMEQATPEIQLAVIDNMNNRRRINTQIARFVLPMNSQFGREARVEIGFSLINAPTR